MKDEYRIYIYALLHVRVYTLLCTRMIITIFYNETIERDDDDDGGGCGGGGGAIPEC